MRPHVERSRGGTVVNNLLYLSLGYQMVFKVVRLGGESKLLSPSHPFLPPALRDETKGKIVDYIVELCCILKLVFIFSFVCVTIIRNLLNLRISFK